MDADDEEAAEAEVEEGGEGGKDGGGEGGGGEEGGEAAAVPSSARLSGVGGSWCSVMTASLRSERPTIASPEYSMWSTCRVMYPEGSRSSTCTGRSLVLARGKACAMRRCSVARLAGEKLRSGFCSSR